MTKQPGDIRSVKPLLNDLYRSSDSAEDDWVDEVSCPDCGSSRVWFFKLSQMEQGYMCRDCGAWDYT